jgi:hypothetical protein
MRVDFTRKRFIFTHLCVKFFLITLCVYKSLEHVKITLVKITPYVHKSHLWVSKSHYAWKNYTCASSNHTRACRNHTFCVDFTLRVKIRLVRVDITLWVYKSHSARVNQALREEIIVVCVEITLEHVFWILSESTRMCVNCDFHMFAYWISLTRHVDLTHRLLLINICQQPKVTTCLSEYGLAQVLQFKLQTNNRYLTKKLTYKLCQYG